MELVPEQKSDSSDSVVLKKKKNFMQGFMGRQKKSKLNSKNLMSSSIINDSLKIPLNQRHDYKLVQKGANGQLYYTQVQNSDIIYINDLAQIFKVQLFTQEVREQHLKDIKKKLKFDQMALKSSCEHCTEAFKERMGGLFSNKEYCEYCMSFICSNCVSKPDES